MLINHTNHQKRFWSQKQLDAAAAYGEVIDLPFPAIDPRWDDAEINLLIESNLKKIEELKPEAVMCQGEFVYTYRMVQRIKQLHITALAACSIRQVNEHIEEDGTTKKESVFEFVQFREY